MRRHLATLLALAGAVTLGACSPPAPEVNTPADISAVNALRDSFTKAFNSDDADAVASGYTTDAISSGNHQPTATGRPAILAAMKAQFAQISETLQLIPDETRTMGSMGYDRGHFKVTITPKTGGPSMTDEGHYLVMLQKGTDGAWKVSYDISNSSMPMPAPPPPPHAAAAAKPKPKGKGK